MKEPERKSVIMVREARKRMAAMPTDQLQAHKDWADRFCRASESERRQMIEERRGKKLAT